MKIKIPAKDNYIYHPDDTKKYLNFIGASYWKFWLNGLTFFSPRKLLSICVTDVCTEYD